MNRSNPYLERAAEAVYNVMRHFRGVTTPPDDIAREMLQQRNQARATAAGLQKQNRKLTAIIDERDIRIASLTAEVAKHENGDAHKLIETLRGKYDDAMATMEELAKRAQPFSFEEAERLQRSDHAAHITRLENEIGTFQSALIDARLRLGQLATAIAQRVIERDDYKAKWEYVLKDFRLMMDEVVQWKGIADYRLKRMEDLKAQLAQIQSFLDSIRT